MGKDFPLNLKDNSAWDDLQELADAGVDSLKIEGRIKKFHYVYTITAAWRAHLDRLFAGEALNRDKQLLYSVFNRDFSNGYLQGTIPKDMFIDNPRDHSAIHRAEQQGGSTPENLELAKGAVFDERTLLISTVEAKINELNIPDEPLVIRFPVNVPKPPHHVRPDTAPGLAVLINNEADLSLCHDTGATFWYSLPEGFRHQADHLTHLFQVHPHILPWFPAILIGDDFQAAFGFLDEIRPEKIVTNNSGIAYEAWQRGIPWIAGPFLNSINSYTLLSLKENHGGSGAFISNEISKVQMKGLKKPTDFDLYYSIFHPIQLMTSRQCFFHQVSGCTKKSLDESCIRDCRKTDFITNLKQDRIIIEKSPGRFPALYHGMHYLNLESVRDFRELFTGFLFDLSDIVTETRIQTDKPALIRHFGDLLRGNPQSAGEISTLISPTTHSSYQQGI
jgi:putative protease